VIAVVDLGFGDAGKGLMVDWLVRRTGARQVVRFNGGAQAGHNVVTPEGRHHRFAQFGAGSFVDGVETVLGPEVVVHPGALLVEARALTRAGVPDPLARLHVHPDCPIVTPWHQSLNRLRELSRGADRHGSCGVGVGEVARERHAAPDTVLRAAHLLGSDLRERARDTMSRLMTEAVALGVQAADELAVYEERLVDRWIELTAPVAGCVREVGLAPDAVLEGAQGVLLDERYGFHPHTTWSDCTFGPAERLRARLAPSTHITRVGVHRAYHVRHGPGPLPTETQALRPVEHNAANDWQGPVRYGWLDLRLLRYALAAVGGVDGLALTWLDVWAGGPVPVGDGEDLVLPASLREAEALGRSLAPPALGTTEDLPGLLGRLAPVLARSHGPRASDVEGPGP